MPFRDITPNHPGTLKRARNKGFTMQKGTLFNLMHAILLCSFMCVFLCVGVGIACKMAVCWQKTLCCYRNTTTYCFHTEEPLRETKTAKVRAEWFNNLSQWFGHFWDRSHQRSLITRLRSLRALINIHRRDYSLAKHYHCWLTGDCNEGQIFSGISIHVLILQACWTLDTVPHQGTN